MIAATPPIEIDPTREDMTTTTATTGHASAMSLLELLAGLPIEVIETSVQRGEFETTATMTMVILSAPRRLADTTAAAIMIATEWTADRLVRLCDAHTAEVGALASESPQPGLAESPAKRSC